MKILFSGTSSGKVSSSRFHSSILISVEEYNLLVDAGDGISRALMAQGINFNSIHGILFTHLHPDHFSGLSALLIQMKMLGRTDSIDIFIYEDLKSVVENFILQSYLLPERMGFEIRYKTFSNDVQFKVTENLSFTARKNSHLAHLENYKSKYLALSFYSASFLFLAGKKKVIYTSDIGSKEDLYLFKEVSSDLFISEATHLPAFAIFEILNQIAADKFYLTHYSDEDVLELNEILSSFPQNLYNKVRLATDGQIIEI